MANAVCINGQNRVCVDMRTRAFSLIEQRLRHSRHSKAQLRTGHYVMHCRLIDECSGPVNRNVAAASGGIKKFALNFSFAALAHE
jgi:hypothetical protein